VFTTVVARIEAEGLSMTRRLRRASINRLPSRLLLPSRIRRRIRHDRPTSIEALTSIETRARSVTQRKKQEKDRHYRGSYCGSARLFPPENAGLVGSPWSG